MGTTAGFFVSDGARSTWIGSRRAGGHPLELQHILDSKTARAFVRRVRRILIEDLNDRRSSSHPAYLPDLLARCPCECNYCKSGHKEDGGEAWSPEEFLGEARVHHFHEYVYIFVSGNGFNKIVITKDGLPVDLS